MHSHAPSAAEMQAIDWIVRQRDPRFDAWDAFADWLDQSPDHAEIFDALASLDRDIDALPRPAVSPAANADDIAPAGRPRRSIWLGGAVAAALVAAISLPGLDLFGSFQRIETAAGEHRTIALEDGSKIEINGASVVEIDRKRPRFARLETGEAMFHVVHRTDHPFVVETGGAQIVDLGTAFNIVRRDRQTSVAVSEGVVLYKARRDALRIVAGQAVDARDGDTATPRLRDVDVANVGGWRTGLLVYSNAPLSIVAEDLKRTAGMTVRIAPNAADATFLGALVIDRDRRRTIADLAALSGTRAEPSGDGWVLTR